MNKPIRSVAVVIALLFVALFVNLNVVQVVQGSNYRNDPNNQRVLLNEYSNPRGSIVIGQDRYTLARSKSTSDELKYQRVYPHGKAYAAATGYYSYIYGSTGIESAENDVLTGNDPRLFGSNLATLLTGRSPKGGSVVLTLNRAAQEAAYKAMGRRRGAVVALNPRTGAILALVSTPSYDPNRLASHHGAQINAAWHAYNQNKAKPLLNRALKQVYPAGSTFKVIDSAAALRAFPSLQPDTRLPSPNSYWPLQPGRTDACPQNGAAACVQNFNAEVCDNGKTATFALALAKSCNTTFAKLTTQKVGGRRLAAEAKRFGLDGPYSGDSPGDLCAPPALTTPLGVCRSTPGSEQDLSEPDRLAQTAIGQRDVGVTPLQVAMLSAAVANNGTLMKPYLVAQEVRPDLSTLSTTNPEQMSQVLDPQRDQALIQMMLGVVENPAGTGGAAALSGMPEVRVGGKTGTADHGVPNKNGQLPPPDAWFTGFALDKGTPKIAVAVIIENGGVNGNETTGGLAAAPVARMVMSAYLRDQRSG